VRGKWVCHPSVGIGFMGRGGAGLRAPPKK